MGAEVWGWVLAGLGRLERSVRQITPGLVRRQWSLHALAQLLRHLHTLYRQLITLCRITIERRLFNDTHRPNSSTRSVLLVHKANVSRTSYKSDKSLPSRHCYQIAKLKPWHRHMSASWRSWDEPGGERPKSSLCTIYVESVAGFYSIEALQQRQTARLSRSMHCWCQHKHI